MIRKPATPLPWHIEESSIIRSGGKSLAKTYRGGQGNILADTDAAYIVHAANAYPKLIKALRKIIAGWNAIPEDTQVPDSINDGRVEAAEALLRELGEDA